ncbi:MAG: hypothetical protein HRT68_04740 [Flavobacteriaceae bacterium]|nr:hypothetical protein [Flavobacteriaceae bacterium]
MRKLTQLYLLALIFVACQNDDNFTNNINSGNTNSNFTENFGHPITSNFIGKVTDQNNNPISNVTISSGGITTFTNQNGVFVLNNVNIYENFGYITAEKEGYILGSRAVVPTPNGTNDIQIRLLKKNVIGTVTSGVESEVSLPNGSKVKFGGEFIDDQGNSYSGNVDVVVHYLQPNNKDTFTEMPGMLLAQDSNNNAQMLETYGMLSVNLYSPNGENLNITQGSPATLELPVDTSTPNAPDTIPLWYFDEVEGYWKEEGFANRVGNTFVAEVNHFTWWNIDLPCNYINYCFYLVRPGNLPITSHMVEIIRNSTDQIIFRGEMNIWGEESGLIPANETCTVRVFGSGDCENNVIHEEIIGPFNTDVLDFIFVPENPDVLNTTIHGVFNDCLGNPVTNGYINLWNDHYDVLINVTNGEFSYDMNFCIDETLNMIAYDNISGMSTEITSFDLISPEVNLGTLSSCNQISDMEAAFPNLIAYYPFDGSINDITVYGNNGTLNGNLTSVDDRNGNADSAYDFSNGYIAIPSFGTGTNEFTITAWVYNYGTTNDYQCIVSKTSPGRDYVFRIENIGDGTSDGVLNGHYYNSDGGSGNAGYNHTMAPSAFATNEWVHVTIRYDNQTLSLFENGVMVNSQTFDTEVFWSNDYVTIGSLSLSGGDLFKGMMDEIAFFKRALTASEIISIANDDF